MAEDHPTPASAAPAPAHVPLAGYMRRAKARRDGYDPVSLANLSEEQIQDLLDAAR